MAQLKQQIVQHPMWARLIVGPGLIALAAPILQALIAPAQANSNFGSVTVQSAGAQAVTGYTGGSVSLSAIAATLGEEDHRSDCLGYADTDPDHILVLSQSSSSLTIEVDSQGNDTTLLIQGPDEVVYCGDDEGQGSDALIQINNSPRGSYHVWVGTFNAGQRLDYTLRVAP